MSKNRKEMKNMDEVFKALELAFEQLDLYDEMKLCQWQKEVITEEVLSALASLSAGQQI
jgi:hypothetical protein